MIVSGIVQSFPSQSLPDSLTPTALAQGKLGDVLLAQLGGKYFTQCYRGNVYDYGTPLAGVTLTTTGATTQTFGIFNPSGSGKLVIPIKCRVAIVGTMTVASLAWGFKNGLGGSVATASPLATATFVAGVNARTDITGVSSVGKVVSTCTLDAAPTIKRYFGASWGAPVAATAAVFPMMVDDFEGDTIVGPGSMLFLSATLTGSAANDISLTWMEIPA